MFKKFALAAALAALTSSAFAANDRGFYVGADVGRTHLNDAGSDTSFGGFAGYSFTDLVAVELAYRKLADFSDEGDHASVKQTSLSVIGSTWLNKDISLFGRLGYSKLKAEIDGYGSGSKNKVLVGVGAAYAITNHVSARVELQRVDSEAQNLSFGVSYKF
jgi:opacity protein-like surface antigen